MAIHTRERRHGLCLFRHAGPPTPDGHYRDEAHALGVLDRVLGSRLSPDDPVITLEIARAFVARRGQESETTHEHRASLLRVVTRFLALLDEDVHVRQLHRLPARREALEIVGFDQRGGLVNVEPGETAAGPESD